MKTLAQMQEEVIANCKAKGWYDKPVDFDLAMDLLDSEISEALEAWRKWGLNDKTPQEYEWGSQPDPDYGPYMPKPEGVGSEFADIFIRLLDYASRFNVMLPTEDWSIGSHAHIPPFSRTIRVMHNQVTAISIHQRLRKEAGCTIDLEDFDDLFFVLFRACLDYGVDLAFEYERKMAYNRTRPYRHGGLRA